MPAANRAILAVCEVHVFWEGHKILQNLQQLFDWQYLGQMIGGDFAKFCGLLRLHIWTYFNLTGGLTFSIFLAAIIGLYFGQTFKRGIEFYVFLRPITQQFWKVCKKRASYSHVHKWLILSGRVWSSTTIIALIAIFIHSAVNTVQSRFSDIKFSDTLVI